MGQLDSNLQSPTAGVFPMSGESCRTVALQVAHLKDQL
jgi:hypothetical protein